MELNQNLLQVDCVLACTEVSLMEITSSHSAVRVLRPLMCFEVEEFWTLALTSGKIVINAKCLFRGTVDACLIHPRDIFRFACMTNASSILVAHNHPSGDPQPSGQDVRLTQRLRRVSTMMEIPLLDHLIITETEHTSFSEFNWFLSKKRRGQLSC